MIPSIKYQVCFPLRKDWEIDIKFLLITGINRSERQRKEKTKKTIQETKKPSSHASLVINSVNQILFYRESVVPLLNSLAK